MELYQLRAFLAVARTGHMTRAADQLHLTQSAVSKQLKALEEEWGVVLFDRSSTGMVISATGQQLLLRANQVLDCATELAAAVHALRGQVRGVLRLGTIIDPASLRLGEFLRELQIRAPSVEVRLEHGISGDVIERVRERDLDACFYLGLVDDPSLKAVQLSVEHYVVAMPAAWAEQIKAGSWAELRSLPWIRASKRSSQSAIMDGLARAHGLTHRAPVEVDQESSMLDLVEAEVGLCLVRERLALQVLRKKRIKLWEREKIPCPLSMLLRTEDARRPMSITMLDAISRVWSGTY